jgi:hypothetical protein
MWCAITRQLSPEENSALNNETLKYQSLLENDTYRFYEIPIP